MASQNGRILNDMDGVLHMEKTFSVIIPTMAGRETMLRRLVESIPDNIEKIIINDHDLLLAAKRNKGARQAKGEYLLFIDDDNYVKEFSISKMLEAFTEEIGVMGMTGCYDDKKMRIADGGSKRNMLTGFTTGLRTNKALWECDLEHGYEVDEVANAFMIKRSVFEELGGLDEVNFPIDLDEADFCKRAKDAGYRVVMHPQAIVYHKSQTYSHIPNFRRPLSAYFMGRNRILFARKHYAGLRYWCHLGIFLPLFLCFYTASLFWKKNPGMIPHFLKGVFDGLRRSYKNPYQQS